MSYLKNLSLSIVMISVFLVSMEDTVSVPDAVTGDVEISRPQNRPLLGVLIKSYTEVQGSTEHDP